jgi:hypothetical protein
MGKWLDMARREEQAPSADSVFSADSSVSGPKDTKDTNGTVPQAPGALVKSWRLALAAVDPRQPPEGFSPQRWQQLCDDSIFIAGGFAEQAARDGWSGGELFGLLPGHDGWGGITDRLRGSRSLVMTADRANWRRIVNGTVDSMARGEGRFLDLVPLWEVRL